MVVICCGWLYRYRQSPEQQAETKQYYLEKAEKKRIAAELKKQRSERI